MSSLPRKLIVKEDITNEGSISANEKSRYRNDNDEIDRVTHPNHPSPGIPFVMRYINTLAPRRKPVAPMRPNAEAVVLRFLVRLIFFGRRPPEGEREL